MAEQQTVTPTEQSSVPDAGESSFDEKFDRLFGLGDEPQQEQGDEGAREPTPEEPGDELRPEDVESEQSEETQPNEGDGWLDLDRNGERRRVSKEEAKRLAQMGWDYSSNTEKLKADRAALEHYKQAVIAKAQITPEIIDAAANVRAVQGALQPFQDPAFWQRLATEDPIEYPKYEAHYKALQAQYQEAATRLHQVLESGQTIDRVISEQDAYRARNIALERIPTWRDESKRRVEQEKITKYLVSEDFTQQELATLFDPRMLVVARKAMLYDEAVKSRTERQNKVKPAPAMRPGAAPQRVTPQARKQEVVKALHQAKDGDRKKALLDEAIELKFGLK